jgi:hypothetical protein
MSTPPWTYETLAQADGATLENVLRTGGPPDLDELEGWIYCGWNHEFVGKLSGEKFKKGFRKRKGVPYGFNEMCYQDNDRFRGNWNVRMLNGRPIQLGYFRVGMIKDEPRLPVYQPYEHLATFNYNVDIDQGINLPFRFIHDMVVLPNAGDHTLMLCKAYLQFFPWLNVFYCYFLLGHRVPIDFEPFWG